MLLDMSLIMPKYLHKAEARNSGVVAFPESALFNENFTNKSIIESAKRYLNYMRQNSQIKILTSSFDNLSSVRGLRI